jgi:hypothetical protein
MSVTAWIPVVASALELVFAQAKQLGLPAPGPEDVEKLRAAFNEKLNEKLGEILPVAIVGVAAAAVVAAGEINENIDSLGKTPHCPRCYAVLTVHAQVSPGGGASSRTYSCSECGWAGDTP